MSRDTPEGFVPLDAGWREILRAQVDRDNAERAAAAGPAVEEVLPQIPPQFEPVRKMLVRVEELVKRLIADEYADNLAELADAEALERCAGELSAAAEQLAWQAEECGGAIRTCIEDEMNAEALRIMDDLDPPGTPPAPAAA